GKFQSSDFLVSSSESSCTRGGACLSLSNGSAADLCANAFQFNPAHGFCAAKAFLRVQNFSTGESAFAVVISRDAFGQMFGRDRGFAERDAQRVHFRVVADFHGHSKIIGIDGCHNYFSGFLHEHGPDLFRRINSAVPFFPVSKIFSELESSKLSRLPRCGANRFFNLANSKTASVDVPQSVFRQSNAFNRLLSKTAPGSNGIKNAHLSRSDDSDYYCK